MIEVDLENFNISAQRFPIRFIFLNSYGELNEVIKLITKTSSKLIELSSFLLREDSWLTPNDIIKNIKKLNENSIIVPLSEFIRFLDNQKFKSLISSLAEIENSSFRIYIPLIGLWDRFEDLFYEQFYRQDDWAPIWKLDSQSKMIKIYQLSFELNNNFKTNDLLLVSNTREWFELWKQGDEIDEIISLVKPILTNFSNSVPDQTFTEDIIYTPKEFLSKIYNIDVDIPYEKVDKPFWDDLLVYISKANKKNISFNMVIADNFNINDVSKIDINECLDDFLSNNENHYKQWLIKNFIIQSNKFNNTYLADCFKSLQKLNNNNLARKIYLNIFELEYCDKYLEERRILLEKLKEYNLSFPETDFENQFKTKNNLNYKQQLKYLTTTTTVERNKILEIVRENDFDNIISDLKYIYPDLYYYLDWNLNLNEEIPAWILDYFKEYNKSKILNFKSEKLDELLFKYNHPEKFYEWYFKFSKTPIVSEVNNYIIWVDALGVEWLPLLIYYLNYYGKQVNKKVTSRTINSVFLPSATEFNRREESDQKIDNLDKYIHDHIYQYPKSLLEEIEIIKEISREIIKIDSPKITIVSDHGFSFLCTKNFGNFKKYDFKDAKHEGRYLYWKNNVDFKDEDFINTKTESLNHVDENYLISLKHNSLYKTPSREVHGGGTPEEVLVPYIVLENDDKNSIEYKIVQSVDTINISKENQLKITISPQPLSLPIVFCNNEKLSISKDNDQYFIQLNKNLNIGLQKFIIKIDDEEIGEIEIKIKKGGMEEKDYGKFFR